MRKREGHNCRCIHYQPHKTISNNILIISFRYTAIYIALCASLLSTGSQAQNKDPQTRQRLVGIAAYAACKVHNDGYNKQRAELIVSTAITKNSWQAEADWLKTSQAKQTIDLITKAMNPDCSDFDQTSKHFNSAMQAIDDLQPDR